MKVLVTGANGKLGSYVIRALQADHELKLFSRGKPADEFSKHPWIQGDLTDAEACARAVEGVDAIQHIAAMPWPTDHPGSRAEAASKGLAFDATFKANLVGPYYLLDAAARFGVKTVVMAGSNCALGHGSRISKTPFPIHKLPIDETHLCEPEDTYSFSKRMGEDLLAAYSRAYGIRTYVTRIAGICPKERRDKMKQSGPTKSWSEWLYCWVGSEDVAYAHKLLMEKASTLPVHDVYFCNGDDTSCKEPTMELIEKYRPDLLTKVAGLQGHQSLLSNAKLKKAVGWTHQTSWR